MVGLFGLGGLLDGGPVRFVGSVCVAVDVGLGAADVVAGGLARAVDVVETAVVPLGPLVVAVVGGPVALPPAPSVRQSPPAGS